MRPLEPLKCHACSGPTGTLQFLFQLDTQLLLCWGAHSWMPLSFQCLCLCQHKCVNSGLAWSFYDLAADAPLWRVYFVSSEHMMKSLSNYSYLNLVWCDSSHLWHLMFVINLIKKRLPEQSRSNILYGLYEAAILSFPAYQPVCASLCTYMDDALDIFWYSSCSQDVLPCLLCLTSHFRSCDP